jgi:hypothetical protein
MLAEEEFDKRQFDLNRDYGWEAAERYGFLWVVGSFGDRECPLAIQEHQVYKGHFSMFPKEN